MTRAPIFVTLDAMIAAGWGEVPQHKIPENWRDIPREVWLDDLVRIRAEQMLPEKERIADIEDNSRRVYLALAEQVMENMPVRQKRGPKPGYKMPPSTRRHQYRGKYNKRIWGEAAMRDRRSQA